MRKMNKIVALSLVLAMALSMMASAASFKDQATINADLIDEINLLINLGVFSENGTGAGYFEPNGTITRSQAAKIIYVLKNKGVDNGATSWTGLNIFSDVEVGSWYEGYVNYCASTGIIAGTGDGKFTPNGQLTGVELAKMLLVVIGYKADVEGYTGDKWDANILADAEAAGFFVDYELPVRGVVTREWSAEMIVNAIEATKVKYEDGEVVEMYNINNDPITYANQDLGLVETVGVLTETPNIKIDGVANNENGKNTYSAIGSTKFTFDANPALLGQKVTVLSKGTLNTSAKVYGVTAHEDVIVADTTVDAISFSAIANNQTQANLKVNGTTKKITLASDTIDVYVDYTLVNDDAAWGAASGTSTAAAAILGGSKAGAYDAREVKLVDNNGDGVWDKAFMSSVVFGEVTKTLPAKNTIKIDTNNSATDINVTAEEDYEDIVFIDSVEKGDIVKITKDYSTGVELTNIELADVVTGVVSSTSTSGAIVIDGETVYAAPAHLQLATVNVGVSSKAQDLYTDGKYVVYATTAASSIADQSNIAYVIQAKPMKDDWTNVVTNQVEIIKNDGTREVLEYKEVSGEMTFETAQTKIGTVVEYVMTSGKVYFKNLATVTDGDVKVATTAGNVTVDVSEAKVSDGTSTWLIGSDSYFFVKTVDGTDVDYAVVLGSEIKGDVTTVAGAETIAYTADGLPYVVYGVLELNETLPEADASKNVIAMAGSAVTTLIEDETTYYTMSATKLDGTTVTLKSDNANAFTGLTRQFIKYTIGTDGLVDTSATMKIDLTNWSSTATSNYFKGSLTAVDGAKVLIDGVIYDVADDVYTYYVNSFTVASNNYIRTSIVTGETDYIVADTIDDTTATYDNVLYRLNSDKEVTHIIFEVDGEELYYYNLNSTNAQ